MWRLADDVRAEHVAEQVQLRLAGRRRALGHVEDRAVVLAQLDRAVGTDDAVGEVALRGLDLRQAADAVLERRVGRQPVGQLVADAVAQLAAAAAKTSSMSSSPPTATIADSSPLASAS